MLIVGFLGWWYGAGWKQRFGIIGARIARIFDFFSIDLLAKTLFSPFRQIGTEGGGKSLAEQFRAFIDQLISRIIGAFVRTFTIIAGVVVLFLSIALGIIEVALWIAAPLLPVIGVILFATGWVPHVGI